jgi:hypothetical protein
VKKAAGFPQIRNHTQPENEGGLCRQAGVNLPPSLACTHQTYGSLIFNPNRGPKDVFDFKNVQL